MSPKGWLVIERDMRLAGYTQEEIDKAKDRFTSGINILRRILLQSAIKKNPAVLPQELTQGNILSKVV